MNCDYMEKSLGKAEESDVEDERVSNDTCQESINSLQLW